MTNEKPGIVHGKMGDELCWLTGGNHVSSAQLTHNSQPLKLHAPVSLQNKFFFHKQCYIIIIQHFDSTTHS